MADLTNSYSLTDFQRNAKSFIETINETKTPMLLTVNGKIQAVLVDPATYQEMEDTMEQEHLLAAIEEGEQAIREGRTRPAEVVMAEMKEKYGF